MPLVTVLLPVFNAEKYLAQAIESVLGQTFTDFEFLIIDDGSTDSSAEIIHRYSDPRIRYLKNEQNIKLVRTLNRGLAEAKGEFIARMDSDDICFPQRLERQVQFFRREPDTMVAGTFAIRIDERNRHGALLKRPLGQELMDSVWFPTPLLHPTVMMRRSLVAKGFRYDENSVHCEDYDLWIRIVRAGHRVENLPAPLLYYRMHGGGISFQNRQLQLEKSFEVFRRYYAHVQISYEEYRGLIGVERGKVSWLRRLDLVKKITRRERFSTLSVVRQGLLHLRLSLGRS